MKMPMIRRAKAESRRPSVKKFTTVQKPIVLSGFAAMRNTLATLYASGISARSGEIRRTLNEERQGHDIQNVLPFVKLMFGIELIKRTATSAGLPD